MNLRGLLNPGGSDDLITLGRVLFYDKNLSKDKSVSCASCHNQKLAFSDNVDFSTGSENRKTSRNKLSKEFTCFGVALYHLLHFKLSN
jgi:cytochrome c peroxidase